MRRLGFLAAEAAPHAPADADHLVLPQSQDSRDDRLDLRGVLGGGVDGELTAFARNRQSRLGFEIKMLLPAADEHPFEKVLGIRQRRGNIATRNAPCRTDELLLRDRILNTQDGR